MGGTWVIINELDTCHTLPLSSGYSSLRTLLIGRRAGAKVISIDVNDYCVDCAGINETAINPS